jgi:glycosyltransferase involved in cell wall biosynthesis
VSVRARALALLIVVPGAGAALGLALGPSPVVALLALVWAVFLLQVFSGRSARALVRYGRVRRALIQSGGREGARRTIPVPRRSEGAPRVAWCHDGWAHADGHLLGLDLLDARYDVTAFGTESRARGEPPVTLELLPAVHHDDGITLEGLEELLRPFDVVWAGGSYEGTTLQALDARASGGPAVVCYEVENVVANYGHVRHPIRERAVREVDHFCAISGAAAAVLELDGVEPERISVVPPVVETPAYSDAERADLRAEGRRRWQLAPDDVVFLFMGRAVWEKGLHTIAAAAAEVARRDEGGRVRWLIAGGGDYLGELERIVERYGAADALRIAGPVVGHDRHLAYAASDALVVPSLPTPRWLEQFGRVIPEGFAFGLPAIGSASGAIPEVIGDAGIVVPPADHLALADAVVRLAGPGLRTKLSARARERLAAEYAKERFVERIAEALEAALAQRAPARSARS